MKKLSVLVLAGVLALPVIAWADDNVPDQVLTANSVDATDSAIPATVAPVVAAVGNIRQQPGLNAVSKTVDILSQQITELQAEVIQLQQQTQQTREQISKMLYAVYGLSGLVIILALLSLARSRKKAVPAQMTMAAAGAGGSQAEYDFMASNEAIPAKLDLARAYIAMEDFTAAREALAAVLSEGNQEQRLEAKSLLNKIK